MFKNYVRRIHFKLYLRNNYYKVQFKTSRQLRSTEQDRIREVFRSHKCHTHCGPIRIVY